LRVTVAVSARRVFLANLKFPPRSSRNHCSSLQGHRTKHADIIHTEFHPLINTNASLPLSPLETVSQCHCKGVPACGRQETTEALSRVKRKNHGIAAGCALATTSGRIATLRPEHHAVPRTVLVQGGAGLRSQRLRRIATLPSVARNDRRWIATHSLWGGMR